MALRSDALIPARPGRPAWQPVVMALICAGALCSVFATRVTPTFRSFRLKAVTRTVVPTGGAVIIEVPAFDNAAVAPPFALVARIRNLSSGPQRFSTTVDDERVCEADVRNGDHRVDCVATAWDVSRSHRVRVAALGQDPNRWSLLHLEISTHHGATRNYDLIVVPAAAGGGLRPAWPWVPALLLLFGSLAFVPPPPLTRLLARVHATGLVLMASFLAVVWLAPLLTSYRVLLSPRLFLALSVAAYVPRLWAGVSWLLEDDGAPGRRRAGLVLIVAALAFGMYVVVVERLCSDLFHGNCSGFLRISRTMFDNDPMLNQRKDVRDSLVLTPAGGYDGQFMYFAAFDPLLTRYRSDPAVYRSFIDAPPYRFGRIGFSWLAVIFSGGRWAYFPSVMMGLILGALAGVAACLALADSTEPSKVFLGALVVLIPGFWQSVQLCLPEPVAACLLLAGYLLARRRRPVLAGLVFALSLLIRETGAVLVVALAAEAVWGRRRKEALTLMAVALVPYVLWRLYVGWVLWPDWGLQGFWLNVNNVGVPLAGLIELMNRVRSGSYYPNDPAVPRAAVYFCALLVAGFALALFAAVRSKSAPAAAAAIYGALALSLTYDSIWLHVGNGQRGTYEMFLALALVTATTTRPSRAMKLALGVFWAASAGYVFYGSFDSILIRLAFLT
jgi:hypothetical protein